MTETVTLDLLARLCEQTLREACALRKEVADVRTLSLQSIEYARRIERRMGEQRTDEIKRNSAEPWRTCKRSALERGDI